MAPAKSKGKHTKDSSPSDSLCWGIQNHYVECAMFKREQAKQIMPYLLSKHAPNALITTRKIVFTDIRIVSAITFSDIY